MDGDPAVEPRLDSFSLTFPLPYRVAFIVVLGKEATLSLLSTTFILTMTLQQPSGDGASIFTTCTTAKSTFPP